LAEAKGVWIDGRISKKEMEGLQQLIKTACEKFAKGELPWDFVNERITFKAWSVGSTLQVFYGWNFPPEAFWSKEVKSSLECKNCFPAKNGEKGSPAREVWCEKLGYNFPRCPYGVETINKTVRGIAS
jgi:hypothetical protein